MRVVGGTARGRRLDAPSGDRTRPTSDRVREAIFNALWSRGVLDGARVLDLYAGSGALGIEALSRGAAHATFVESDRDARRAIAANLGACGFTDRAGIAAMSVDRFLAGRVDRPVDRFPPGGDDRSVDRLLDSGGDRSVDRHRGARDDSYSGGPPWPYDIAFCDPPYAFDDWDDLLERVPADLVVVESGRPVAPPGGWALVRESRYGDTCVSFMSRSGT
jgi:16S rRNA (guanine966-N2)-methyltransferase